MDTAEARDTISSQINIAWGAYAGGLDPSALFFQDRKKDGPPESAITWGRLLIQHLQGRQEALSNSGGKIRYSRDILITLQLFTPFNDGLVLNDSLSQYFVEVFQGKGFGSLWFKDVFSKEIGSDGNWFQTNVLVSAEYDQIK